ncbi:MAG: branched-chain amino acid transporter permease [Candidatus Cryosericum sp.]
MGRRNAGRRPAGDGCPRRHRRYRVLADGAIRRPGCRKHEEDPITGPACRRPGNDRDRAPPSSILGRSAGIYRCWNTFALFSRTRPPRWVATVETVLPPLVLWLLVFYSLNSVVWRTTPYGIPALAGVTMTVLAHRWKHNTLLSILSGTVVYLILTRLLA